MPCVEPAAGADLGLLGDCLLTRQAGHLDRRDAARFDQGRGPLHSGRRLFPSRGRGLDRRLDFGDARLELKDAAIAELARLAGEALLRGLGGASLAARLGRSFSCRDICRRRSSSRTRSPRALTT
ncbi:MULTISPECIES: hypothetical protein [Bradyrhizobium]|uniref:hypothetical protein n=1 Tax=Bradyrhizobium TaxID=374 RepID=UPI002013290F|nr:hypothetical protein [Bradyrhizobium ottawaense]